MNKNINRSKLTTAAFGGFCKKNYAFDQSKCILPISVGQHYHESKQLTAIIDLVNKTFKSCIIMVCDSLQRHTLNLFQREPINDNYHILANQLGDEWLKRNENTISKLSIPNKIMRWDYWLKHQLFETQKQQIDNLYQNNEKFRLAMQNGINDFLDRCRKRMGDNVNYTEFFSASLKYFKEECSITSLWSDEKIDFIIYPLNAQM